MKLFKLIQAGWDELPAEFKVVIYGFIAACFVAVVNFLQSKEVNIQLLKDTLLDASKFYIANILLVFIVKLNTRKETLRTRNKK